MGHTTSTKLITLSNLATYNHELCAKLGLTQDTAGYAYATSGITNPASYTKATNVKQALDQLYDLVGLGAGIKSVASGKSSVTDSSKKLAEAEFTRDTTDTTNDLYYIHITTADGKEQDIKLDATDFVKDSFLAGAKTVWGSSTTAPTKPADTTATKDATHDAAYIELTMTCKGDADVEAHNEYIYVKTSDILGDLVAGNGIDITGSTISVKVDGTTDANSVKLTSGADGVKVEVVSTTFAKADGDWTKTGTSVIADADSTLAAINGLQDQIDGLAAKGIKGKDAIKVEAKEGDATTQVVELKLDGSYLSQSEAGLAVETGNVTYTASTTSTASTKFSGEANDLASTVEVAKVANELQGEIDAINAKSTTHVGGANVTAAPEGASSAANGAIYFTTTTEGNATTVTGGAIVATEDEIKGLFAVDATA